MSAASNHKWSVEPTGYLHWPKAYRCHVGELDLTVVASIGPRILSLRRNGGPNLLALDPADFRVGDWRLYGGHRFTTAPEGEPSYSPDNAVCEVQVADNSLSLSSSSSPCGVLKSIEISARLEGDGFLLRHTLSNVGSSLWHGAPWAITCVSPFGSVVLPHQTFASLPRRPIRFWNGRSNNYAGPLSRQWVDKHDHLLIRPNGERGKIGLFSGSAWIAWVGAETVFCISCPQVVAPEGYPDGGCNLEVFTCRHYLELEHVGPLVTLTPGSSVALEEHWRVFPVSLNCEDWPEIRRWCESAMNLEKSNQLTWANSVSAPLT
jgi:hypothetical protein